jgi:hypothetical protein
MTFRLDKDDQIRLADLAAAAGEASGTPFVSRTDIMRAALKAAAEAQAVAARG